MLWPSVFFTVEFYKGIIEWSFSYNFFLKLSLYNMVLIPLDPKHSVIKGLYCNDDFVCNRRHCVVSLSKNINPSLVLVQPRKTHPFITERF